MATMVEEWSRNATMVEEWSRNCCSICMEPFRGRNPKFLPCFHTFCVPCLSQLEERARAQTVQPYWARDQSNIPVRVSIVCPTCRKSTVIPAQGVTSFQTNFYIDDNDDHPFQQNPRCDLCNEGHEAEFACSTCPSKFCLGCRSVHEQICDWAAVYKINDFARDSSSSTGDLAAKVKVVSAKMQRLEKLTEVTPMLTRDLNAAQTISSKIRSDVSSLQASLTAQLDAIQLLRSDFNKQKEELQHSQNNLESRQEGLQASINSLREGYNELKENIKKHVGPTKERKWNASGFRDVDVSDHGKIKEQFDTGFGCGVVIVGLLLIAFFVNVIVLTVFYNKFVDPTHGNSYRH